MVKIVCSTSAPISEASGPANTGGLLKITTPFAFSPSDRRREICRITRCSFVESSNIGPSTAVPAPSTRKPATKVSFKCSWTFSVVIDSSASVSRSLKPALLSRPKRCSRLGVRRSASTKIVGMPLRAATIAVLAATAACAA